MRDGIFSPRGDSLREILREYVLRGKVYDLGQPWQRGMPLSPLNPPFVFSLSGRHGDKVTPQGMSAANDLLCMGSHVGTHIDALGHMSRHGKLHGGIEVAEAQKGADGLTVHGVENIPPLIQRCVFLDIAAHKKVDFLSAGYVVSALDLEEACSAQGSELQVGDAVLVRTGWAKNWSDAAVYPGHDKGAPGVGQEAARWLAAREPSVVGSDSMSFEVRPSPYFTSVHGIFLVDHGVPIMENLYLEELSQDRCFAFVLIVLPLKIVGGTASPVRPIALA